MYKPVDKFPDLAAIEKRILSFWSETKAFELLRQKNHGGEKFRFQDGPITANNPMGVHHAWGRTLKDLYQRYHAMCGRELRYQNGFDCQGLWVEVEVEKDNGFTSKKDILAYGIDRFVEDCKARVRKFSAVQTDQSIRLGYWMDWDNSYYTMDEENNYAIWQFLKRCHAHGHIYRGFDAMPWCPRCGVGLSQMELAEGYKWVEHKSVFLRLPLRGRENEALLVWTTTPWTLTANVGAAVHPDMRYHKVRQGDWHYYVGADNWEARREIETDQIEAGGRKRRTVKLHPVSHHLEALGECQIVQTLRGEDLVGLEYDGPFDELPAQQQGGGYPHAGEWAGGKAGVDCHRVIAWDAVTGSEGTGIVHIAPGCGQEDYQLGKEFGLAAVSPLDENGRYIEGFGPFTGAPADEVADDVIAGLTAKGLFVAEERYPHRYAHCWRCKTPIVYRLVDEWYISMDWRDRIIEAVPQIRWIPAYGEQREMDWLRNMGDWMISKKRFWGLALPIWRCDRHGEEDRAERCDWFTVVGSREELRELAVEGWDEFDGHTPHRPWVDEVRIRCERCGGPASRIPDVGNPWLDAGIVPLSTVGYFCDREYWRQWSPADLVLECFAGQFRNWFYALLAMSAMMQDETWDAAGAVTPPFRTLLGHALVRDEIGREMHKSLGNAVQFDEAAETIGAETMRHIYASQNPAYDLNFPDISPGRRTDVVHLDQEVYRKLLTLWNCYSFYVTYAALDGITPDRLDVPPAERSELDRWIVSKLQGLIRTAHESMADYAVHLLMARFEEFLDHLSNWYLRRSRRRFWKSANDTDKLAAYTTLFECLQGLCRLMAPVLPFLTEEIYQNIVRAADETAPVSVHLLEYPRYDESKVDASLEQRIDTLLAYKNMALRVRTTSGVKIRQPLAKMFVKPADDAEKLILLEPEVQVQLLEEVNVKAIEVVDSTEGLLKTEIRPNFAVLGRRHGPKTKEIQARIAQADSREIMDALAGGSYVIELADGPVALTEEDLEVRREARPDVAFAAEGDRFVALNTAITDELKQEGIARDFVRQVQQCRKDLDLAVSDRIAVRYRADGPVRQAVQAWERYVCRETLAVALAHDDRLDEAGARRVRVGGGTALLALEPAGPGPAGRQRE